MTETGQIVELTTAQRIGRIASGNEQFGFSALNIVGANFADLHVGKDVWFERAVDTVGEPSSPTRVYLVDPEQEWGTLDFIADNQGFDTTAGSSLD